MTELQATEMIKILGSISRSLWVVQIVVVFLATLIALRGPWNAH